jgi:predicted nucleic acid-binding protein
MNGSDSILPDTNALIYYFNGHLKVVNALRNKILYIPSIVEIEILSFPKLETESELQIRALFSDPYCSQIDLIPDIKELTIQIRKVYQVKLPDAIIAASAIYLDIPLLTFDTGFTKIKDLDLVLIES